MKSHKKQILRLLENHGDSLSTKQIRGALGLNKTATAKLKAELLKLIKAGKISKQGTRYFKAQEKPIHAVSKEKRKDSCQICVAMCCVQGPRKENYRYTRCYDGKAYRRCYPETWRHKLTCSFVRATKLRVSEEDLSCL